ncbi:MAG TPA: rhamnulokinase family protein [Pyrinomonadaceae bacterium]|nr:rhamnulokinase family protein [Pyrinomonadaceae bacterium]
MTEPLYIAVDLGAGSGRVFLAGVGPGELLLEEVRRFHYPPTRSAGHLRWDLPQIFGDIKQGLSAAVTRARALGRRIESIGVDSWGVDYGLLDGAGELLEHPVCYRDERTQSVMEQVFASVSREEIFEHTGIQFMALNTLFQLVAHAGEGLPAAAQHLLLIPDLINYFLTNERLTEYTNATTTQMVNARTRTWDDQLLGKLGLPASLLPPLVDPGAELGKLTSKLAGELAIDEIRVVAPATHDTGSAVAGAPLPEGWAYISSGTWSLVGIERDEVLINAEVLRHNFTNEGGAAGTIRFLKNVMGLWILESCRREWQQTGTDADHDRLLEEVAAISHYTGFIFPDDQRFFSPENMVDAISAQLEETSQSLRSGCGATAKCILDSLAFRYASVLRTIESLSGQAIQGVQIIGGGSRNAYLNQATANATGLPVCAGPVEATVIGNVLVQAIAHGRFSSLAEARQHVAQNTTLEIFTPRVSAAVADARERYAAIEKRYCN